MKPETLIAISQIAIVAGAILAGLGGFGSYYFGNKAAEAKDLSTAEKELAFNQKIDQLVSGSHQLSDKLNPFVEMAQKLNPNLDQSEALQKLRDDFEHLREIAAKNEFTPLDKEIRQNLVENLQNVRKSFPSQSLAIKITHETWIAPPTRQFAVQLAKILTDAGFDVSGPEFATVYLASPSYPIEWAYSKDDERQMNKIYEAIREIIEKDEKHAIRPTFPKGQARIHFGGKAVFKKNGTIDLE